MKPLLDIKIDKSFYALFTILITAVVLRLFYFSEITKSSFYPVLPHSDSYCYYIWAKDISCGTLIDHRVFMRWPLYAYFLGFLFKVFGENLGAVFLLQFSLGVLNCWLIYLIAEHIFNKKIALLSSFFYLITGQFIFYEGLIGYTPLSIFLNLLFVLLLLKSENKIDEKRLFLLGILLGIAALTLANIFVLGTCLIVWILIKKRLSFLKIIFNSSIFLSGVLLIVSLATIRNYLAEKDFVLVASNLGLNFYAGNNPQANGAFFNPDNISFNQDDMIRDYIVIANTEMGKRLKTSEVSRFWFRKGLAFIVNEPGKYLKLLFKKLSYVLTGNVFSPDIEYNFVLDEIKIFKYLNWEIKIIVIFSLLGMVFALKKGNHIIVLYLAVIALSASVISFFVAMRYMMSALPFAIIFAGFGFYTLFETLLDRNYFKFFLSIGFIFLFIIMNYLVNMESGGKITINNYLTQATKYEIRGDYQKALNILNSIEQSEPANQRILFRQGVIYFFLNDLKQAENKFKRIITINPLRIDAYYNLGLLYNKQNRFNLAKDVLLQGVYLDPDSLNIRYALGVAYKNFGDVIHAEEELNYVLNHLSSWRIRERDMVNNQLKGLRKI